MDEAYLQKKTSRDTFDVNAIPILKEKIHFLFISDPAHGVGISEHMPAIALASVHGIIFEDQDPRKPYSDGQQTLNFNQSIELANNLRKVTKMRLEMV